MARFTLYTATVNRHGLPSPWRPFERLAATHRQAATMAADHRRLFERTFADRQRESDIRMGMQGVYMPVVVPVTLYAVREDDLGTLVPIEPWMEPQTPPLASRQEA
jgi:hypothetical protein